MSYTLRTYDSCLKYGRVCPKCALVIKGTIVHLQNPIDGDPE